MCDVTSLCAEFACGKLSEDGDIAENISPGKRDIRFSSAEIVDNQESTVVMLEPES